MKALITGVNGQLGKALLATQPDGWTCVALDRAALDLSDADAIAALYGVRLVQVTSYPHVIL